jgi:hypothetical protein
MSAEGRASSTKLVHNNEDTVELETDDETEQEYCVIYRPDEDPQNNTNSDAHHVDSDQVRTINFTDEGHVEAGFISFGFTEFSSSGRNPIGSRRFLCNFLCRPSPFSR